MQKRGVKLKKKYRGKPINQGMANKPFFRWLKKLNM